MGRSDVEDLHSDLVFMRKNAGFIASRIVDASTLRFVLGGDHEPFDGLRERFESAIHSLRDDEPELLLNAFALTPKTSNTTTLRARRESYGRGIGRKIDTVASREDAALEHLRAQLLTGWYPASPLTVKVPEMHNGIVQESVNIVTLIKDQKWLETREHYRFFAAFDEADFLTISSSFPGRPVPEGDFTVRTRRVANGYSHDFWHATPMKRGSSYDLRFSLVPDQDYGDPGRVLEESRAFHERTLTASFEAVFIGKKPRRIWSYERLSYFERPGNPHASSVLDFGGRASVQARYRDLYGGLFNGIAWDW